MRVRGKWTMASLAAVVAGGIAVAVPAGIGTAAIVAPGAPAPPQPTSRVVQAGPVTLSVPASWVDAAPVAGLDGSRATLQPGGSSERIVVVFGPADGRSLLPRQLRAQVDGPLPWPGDASLAGRPALGYRALAAGDLLFEFDVTVLPTSGGMLAVACLRPRSDRSDCGSGIRDVSVPGASALMPSPAIPAAARLPAAIAELDRATVAGRAALAAARTPAAQTGLAALLAYRQRITADELRSAFGIPVARATAALDRAADGYDALGAAAAAGSPRAFAAARRDVLAAETALAAAVDTVMKNGTRPSPTRAPAPPATAPAAATPGAVRFAEVVLVMLLLLASVTAGFVSSGPVVRAAARAARRLWAPT
jgi:hypothetical protein